MGESLRMLHKEKRELQEFFSEEIGFSDDFSGIGHWSIDVKSNALDWSEEVFHIYGLVPGSSAPTFEDALNFYHPEDKAYVQKCFQEAIQKGKEFYYQRKIVRKTGEIRHIRSKGSCVRNDQGHPFLIRGISQDVTELGVSQEKVKEQNNVLKAFIESTNDGYWDWYPQKKHEYMSPRFWEILGVNPKEKEHKPSEWFDLIYEDDLKIALENFDKHVETKGKHPYLQNVRYRHENGSTVHILCRGQVVEWGHDGAPIRMIGTHTDITALKEAEIDLYQKSEKLAVKNAQMNEFVHIASHDLKEPLRGLYNHSKFLIKNYRDKLDEKGKHKVERLIELTKKMEDLIQDLLKYAILGQEKSVRVPVDLNILVQECMRLFSALADENLEISIVNKLPIVECDRSKIQDLFRNLFSNALKYTDKEKVLIQVGVLEEAQDENNPVFFVKDNGIGIKKEFYKSVFQIFKRLHPRDAYGGGTGSGLTFIRKIIELHQGKIWLESEPGIGTTFFFTLSKETEKIEGIERQHYKTAGNHSDRKISC